MSERRTTDSRRRCLARAVVLASGAAIVPMGIMAAHAQQTLPPITVEASKKKAAPKRAAKSAPKQAPAVPGIVVDKSPPQPLATGRDLTITTSDPGLARVQSIQDLYARETIISAGGTTQANTKVYVHGIEETMLNVQIDGAKQPQRSGFHHNGNNLIDPSMLKAVAIDAGVASADAGPNALGGAIRYMTKDAADLLLPGRNFGGFAAFSYDSNAHTFKKSGAAYGKSNGLEILGYGMWADGDAYEDGHGKTVIASDVNLVNYLGKIAYEAPTGHRFSLSAEHVQDEGIRPFRANFALIPGFAIPYSFNESTRDTYTFQYRTTRPTEWYDPEVSFYSNKTRLYRPPTGSCAPGSVAGSCVAFGEGEFESVGGKVQNTFVIGPGKLTAGVDFYRDETTVDHLGNNPLFGEKLTNVGGYAQYRFSPLSILRISTGIRFDRNELEAADGKTFETTGASPNIAAELDLTRQLTAKASYGYTFGGIPLYESFLLRTGVPIYSAALDPQNARKYKAGLEFKQGGFQAEATYFNTVILDPVCPNCNPVVNQGDLETRGVDLSARYAWRNGQLGANYTHTDTKFAGDPLSTLSFYYGTPFGDMLKIYGHYEFQEVGVVVGFLSQFIFEYDKAASLPAPGGTVGVLEGYTVHNVFAQWTPNFAPNVTFRADVLNLFDTYYVDRATAIGGTIVPLASPGRTVLVSAKVQF